MALRGRVPSLLARVDDPPGIFLPLPLPLPSSLASSNSCVDRLGFPNLEAPFLALWSHNTRSSTNLLYCEPIVRSCSQRAESLLAGDGSAAIGHWRYYI